MKDMDNTRIHELFLKLTDGSISGEEMAELDGLVSENPRIAKRYNEYISAYLEMQKKRTLFDSTGAAVESIYKQILWEPLLQKDGEKPEISEESISAFDFSDFSKTGKKKKQISRSYFYAVVLSAAALICVLLITQFFVEDKALVATVIESNSIRWQNKGPRIFPGIMMNTGIYEMKNGRLGLQLLQGANVTITAPAVFELLSAKEIYLHDGKIVADVPTQGLGFTVYTSKGKVVDLGTKFGVYADEKTNKTEVAVIDGLVKVHSSQKKSIGKMLHSGNACLVKDGSKGIKKMYFSKSEFAPEVLKAYESLIYKTNPDGYWKFSDLNENIVTNKFGRVKYDAILKGKADVIYCGQSDYFDKGISLNSEINSYFDFGDESILNPGRDSYTVSIWFKPDFKNPEAVQTLASKMGYLNNKNLCGWQIQFNNDLFLIKTITDKGNFVCIYKEVKLTNQWHHIVMVIDRKQRILKGYLDGSFDDWEVCKLDMSNLSTNRFFSNLENKPVFKGRYDKSERIDNFESFSVGASLSTKKHKNVVSCNGLFYDIAVWKHALSKYEINELYGFWVEYFKQNGWIE